MSRTTFKWWLLSIVGWFVIWGSNGPLFAADSDTEIVARIDTFIRQGWEENEVDPSEKAGDGEYARRAALDIVGRIPSYDELMDLLEDKSADRRKKYVDRFLDHPDYVKNWTNIWANLLVGRGNNRGNRAVLERWLRSEIYRNTPYDKFTFELISAEGSSSENGAVAFLASHLNEGGVPATSITSRLFLGMQVQCTQCHDHPFNDWNQSQFWSMNAFFRGTRRAGGPTRGEFSLTDQPQTGVVFYEKRNGIRQATRRQFVDGSTVPLTAEAKPRKQLAELVTSPTRPYMSRAQVNRMWGHFFGYGFTRPVDDMGPHKAPSHPELLEYLGVQLREAGYDNKRLIRWITASEAYSLTSRYGENNAIDAPADGETPLFSHLYLKQFTAEQLYDSLLIATAADKAGNRSSEAAQNQRRTWLRQFIQTFGTDENDEATTFNGTIPQSLVLMNGDLMNDALSGAQGAFLRRLLDAPGGNIRSRTAKSGRKRAVRKRRPLSPKAQAREIPKKIETLFLVALSRKPTADELDALDTVFRKFANLDPITGLQDVFWAILNSNEFIINH